MASIICSHSRPIPYPGQTVTLPTHSWQFASTTCEIIGNVSTTAPGVEVVFGSSTLPITASGFTYGEIMIGVFLFLIWITLMFWHFINWLFRIRIRI